MASSNNGGIGFFGIMQVVLLCAKIFEMEPVVGWSWWWVLSPTLAWIGLVLAVYLGLFIYDLVCEIRDETGFSWRR